MLFLAIFIGENYHAIFSWIIPKKLLMLLINMVQAEAASVKSTPITTENEGNLYFADTKKWISLLKMEQKF